MQLCNFLNLWYYGLFLPSAGPGKPQRIREFPGGGVIKSLSAIGMFFYSTPPNWGEYCTRACLKPWICWMFTWLLYHCSHKLDFATPALLQFSCLCTILVNIITCLSSLCGTLHGYALFLLGGCYFISKNFWPIYILTYYIKWDKTSWTDSMTTKIVKMADNIKIKEKQ